jgi:hypothetical protein
VWNDDDTVVPTLRYDLAESFGAGRENQVKMSTPNNQIDVLSTIFDNPVVKAFLAAVSVFTAIVKYIKGAGQRNRRAATISNLPDAGRQRRRRSGQTRDLPASDAIVMALLSFADSTPRA